VKKLIINYRIKYNKVAARERHLCHLRDTFSVEMECGKEEGAVRISEWNEAVTRGKTVCRNVYELYGMYFIHNHY